MNSVIVLNADFTFLNIVTVERAFLYIAKGKVSIEKYADKMIHTAEDMFKIPKVVRFTKMINQVFKKKIPWTKKNVIIRDKYTCQYCGATDKRMTIDHVMPKSRGGKNSFENCVAACFDCNNWKDDKTPDEAAMTLRNIPVTPTVSYFISLWATAMTSNEVMKELGYINE